MEAGVNDFAPGTRIRIHRKVRFIGGRIGVIARARRLIERRLVAVKMARFVNGVNTWLVDRTMVKEAPRKIS